MRFLTLARLGIFMLFYMGAFFNATSQNIRYVSPTGTATNAGTIASPWSLQYALNGAQAAGKILAGDTIYLRAGLYTGKFTSNLGFSSGQPVIVSNYQNERATINGYTGMVDNAAALTISGRNTFFIGLEITSTSTNRVSTSTPSGNGSAPGDIYTGGGIDVFGTEIKLINCTVHDMPSTGIGTWKTTENNEIYGCLIYNNGFYSTDNNANLGHGPGLYVQHLNPAKPKQIINNFIFKNFSVGVEAKTVTNEPGFGLNGINLDSNTIFNAGAPNGEATSRKYNLYLGSEVYTYNPAQNIYMRGNVFYRDEKDGTKPYYQDGDLKPAYYRQQNITFGTGQIDSFLYFRNNYVIGTSYTGDVYVQNKFRRFDFQYNTIYDPIGPAAGALVATEVFAKYNPTDTVKITGIWNNNRYFSPVATPFSRHKAQTRISSMDLNGFRTLYNVDANSLQSQGRPADTALVRRNKYRPDMFYVTVLNHSKQPFYNLSISAAGFSGYYYTVIDAQNYYGDPVSTGVFNGSSISLPMGLEEVAAVVGNVPTPVLHTSAAMGSFIIKFSQTPPVAPCNPASNLSISNNGGSSITLNWAAAPGAINYVIQQQNGTVWDSIASTTATTYTINGLPRFGNRVYRIGTKCTASAGLRFSNTISAPGKYFVATSGTAANPGTITQPWSLSYALNGANGLIKAGDSVFVRAGNYNGNYVAQLLEGTAALPIVFKNYNNERASIDGYTGVNSNPALTIGSFCNHVYFVGLEVKSSSPSRLSSGNNTMYTGAGVNVQGNYIHLVNCIIHDNPGSGISANKQDAKSTEIYGCLVYNNGYEQAGVSYANGIELQNDNLLTKKAITNNFVYRNYTNGIIAYGGTNAETVNGIGIDSNTVINTGAMLTATLGRKYNFLISGVNTTYSAKNILVNDNVFYRDETDGAGGDKPHNLRYNLSFGQKNSVDSSLAFQRNHVTGGGFYGNIFVQGNFKKYTFSENTFYNNNGTKLFAVNTGVTLPGVWNQNSYYSNNTSAFNSLPFATWKTTYSVDATSTYSSAVAPNAYFVRQNKYEPGVYYVTVLNHAKAASFTLPLSAAPFNGRPYEVVDAQNFYGAAVASGTFNGSSVVLPMNLTAVAAPLGTVAVAPQHTNAALGTFIIRFADASAYSTIYSFYGSGSWNSTSNWAAGIVPPETLPAGSKIIINTPVDGACQLSRKQTIASGAMLEITPGSHLIVGEALK